MFLTYQLHHHHHHHPDALVNKHPRANHLCDVLSIYQNVSGIYWNFKICFQWQFLSLSLHTHTHTCLMATRPHSDTTFKFPAFSICYRPTWEEKTPHHFASICKYTIFWQSSEMWSFLNTEIKSVTYYQFILQLGEFRCALRCIHGGLCENRFYVDFSIHFVIIYKPSSTFTSSSELPFQPFRQIAMHLHQSDLSSCASQIDKYEFFVNYEYCGTLFRFTMIHFFWSPVTFWLFSAA